MNDIKYIEEKTASIDFLPTCSACGTRIETRVYFFYEATKAVNFADNKTYCYGRTLISPPSCCNCGLPFVSIRIPNKLPFEGIQ